GAFTGATSAHTGKFREAHGGTLFLDEVGELTPELQVKLLRAIQEGEVDPVGAKRPSKVDIRIVSATNRDMITMVQDGSFREDLYYRLNVFPILVPPLRKRRGDIAPLVRHITARLCLEEGRREISGIRRDALAMLEAQDWPGNVRQLENALFRAVILCEGDELTVDDFPHFAPTKTAAEQAGSVTLTETPAASAPQFAMLPMLDDAGNVVALNDMEEAMIRFAIHQHGGRMTRVARSLGIGRSTLYRKLKEMGIDANEPEVAQTAG
ncbi:MAG: sigma-54 dependent transcriptional regulator, partial [Pseudomonadota bacterium]